MWCKHPRDTRRPPANQENERTTGPFVVQIRVQTRCKGVQRCKPGQPRRPGATPLDEAAARRSPSPPAQHLHQHRHHAADDSPGAGADRGNPLLSHLTVLELLPRTFGAHAPALRAIAPCGQSFLSNLLRPPTLQRPEPALKVLVRRPSVFSRSGSNEPSRVAPHGAPAPALRPVASHSSIRCSALQIHFTSRFVS